MEKGYLLHGKPCIKFVMGCKLKHKIELNKFTTDGNIDIQQVSAKHFFWMIWKKDHKNYLWIPRVSTDNCKKECCAGVGSNTRKWYASTVNSIVLDNFDKFMKGKPNYSQEKLLEKALKEYHSMINIFMKCGADMLPE